VTLLAAGSPDFPDEVTTLDSLIQPIVLARLVMLWRAGLCDGSVHHPLFDSALSLPWKTRDSSARYS
jgi:hypothetical protein